MKTVDDQIGEMRVRWQDDRVLFVVGLCRILESTFYAQVAVSVDDRRRRKQFTLVIDGLRYVFA